MRSRLNRPVKAVLARIPPRYQGYRFLPNEDLLRYAERVPGCELLRLAAADDGPAGLPLNVPGLEQLPDMVGRWGRSFRDVPTRSRPAPVLASIADGTVVAAGGDWDLQHFAVLAPEGLRLTSPGLRWIDGHRRLLTSHESEHHLDRLVWPWESWYLNHFHWMVRHVPKLAWIREHGLLDFLMIPRHLELTDLHRASAKLVGVDLDEIPRAPSDRLSANNLTMVVVPGLHPCMVSSIRGPLSNEERTAGGRRLYIRRPHAGKRQISNESDVRAILRSFGFEEVVFEQMSFEDQVGLCGEASVIFGLHGAGLANAVLAPQGTHVIEAIDPLFPNPEYYELSVVARHRYWMLSGEPVPGDQEWGYGDVYVSPQALRAIVERAVGSR